MNQTFSSIQKKLEDTTWIESQDKDFVEAIQHVESIIRELSTQIYLFVDYFQQYVHIIQSSQLFAGNDNQSSDVDSQSPTQTPANRAERRAADKQQKKLLVPEGKKLIVP